MRLRSFAIIGVAFTAALVFSACSENSTTPDTAKNYYPLTIGSSWQYEMVTLDTAGKEQDTPIPYSITAERTTDTLGKTKATILKYSLGGSDVVTQEGTLLLIFESPFSFSLPNVTVKERWNKYADFASTATEWTIYDTTLTNIASQIEVDGQMLPVIINGTASVKGTRVGTETITVKGKSYANCLKIKRTTGTEFKVKTTILGFPVEIPITASVTSTQWYSDGVGIVKSESTALVPRPDLSSIPASFKSQVKDAINELIEPGGRIELTASTVK